MREGRQGGRSEGRVVEGALEGEVPVHPGEEGEGLLAVVGVGVRGLEGQAAVRDLSAVVGGVVELRGAARRLGDTGEARLERRGSVGEPAELERDAALGDRRTRIACVVGRAVVVVDDAVLVDVRVGGVDRPVLVEVARERGVLGGAAAEIDLERRGGCGRDRVGRIGPVRDGAGRERDRVGLGLVPAARGRGDLVGRNPRACVEAGEGPRDPARGEGHVPVAQGGRVDAAGVRQRDRDRQGGVRVRGRAHGDGGQRRVRVGRRSVGRRDLEVVVGHGELRAAGAEVALEHAGPDRGGRVCQRVREGPRADGMGAHRDGADGGPPVVEQRHRARDLVGRDVEGHREDELRHLGQRHAERRDRLGVLRVPVGRHQLELGRVEDELDEIGLVDPDREAELLEGGRDAAVGVGVRRARLDREVARALDSDVEGVRGGVGAARVSQRGVDHQRAARHDRAPGVLHEARRRALEEARQPRLVGRAVGSELEPDRLAIGERPAVLSIVGEGVVHVVRVVAVHVRVGRVGDGVAVEVVGGAEPPLGAVGADRQDELHRVGEAAAIGRRDRHGRLARLGRRADERVADERDPRREPRGREAQRVAGVGVGEERPESGQGDRLAQRGRLGAGVRSHGRLVDVGHRDGDGAGIRARGVGRRHLDVEHTVARPLEVGRLEEGQRARGRVDLEGRAVRAPRDREGEARPRGRDGARERLVLVRDERRVLHHGRRGAVHRHEAHEVHPCELPPIRRPLEDQRGAGGDGDAGHDDLGDVARLQERALARQVGPVEHELAQFLRHPVAAVDEHADARLAVLLVVVAHRDVVGAGEDPSGVEVGRGGAHGLAVRHADHPVPRGRARELDRVAVERGEVLPLDHRLLARRGRGHREIEGRGDGGRGAVRRRDRHRGGAGRLRRARDLARRGVDGQARGEPLGRVGQRVARVDVGEDARRQRDGDLGAHHRRAVGQGARDLGRVVDVLHRELERARHGGLAVAHGDADLVAAHVVVAGRAGQRAALGLNELRQAAVDVGEVRGRRVGVGHGQSELEERVLGHAAVGQGAADDDRGLSVAAPAPPSATAGLDDRHVGEGVVGRRLGVVVQQQHEVREAGPREGAEVEHDLARLAHLHVRERLARCADREVLLARELEDRVAVRLPVIVGLEADADDLALAARVAGQRQPQLGVVLDDHSRGQGELLPSVARQGDGRAAVLDGEPRARRRVLVAVGSDRARGEGNGGHVVRRGAVRDGHGDRGRVEPAPAVRDGVVEGRGAVEARRRGERHLPARERHGAGGGVAHSRHGQRVAVAVPVVRQQVGGVDDEGLACEDRARVVVRGHGVEVDARGHGEPDVREHALGARGAGILVVDQDQPVEALAREPVEGDLEGGLDAHREVRTRALVRGGVGLRALDLEQRGAVVEGEAVGVEADPHDLRDLARRQVVEAQDGPFGDREPRRQPDRLPRVARDRHRGTHVPRLAVRDGDRVGAGAVLAAEPLGRVGDRSAAQGQRDLLQPRLGLGEGDGDRAGRGAAEAVRQGVVERGGLALARGGGEAHDARVGVQLDGAADGGADPDDAQHVPVERVGEVRVRVVAEQIHQRQDEHLVRGRLGCVRPRDGGRVVLVHRAVLVVVLAVVDLGRGGVDRRIAVVGVARRGDVALGLLGLNDGGGGRVAEAVGIGVEVPDGGLVHALHRQRRAARNRAACAVHDGVGDGDRGGLAHVHGVGELARIDGEEVARQCEVERGPAAIRDRHAVGRDREHVALVRVGGVGQEVDLHRGLGLGHRARVDGRRRRRRVGRLGHGELELRRARVRAVRRGDLDGVAAHRGRRAGDRAAVERQPAGQGGAVREGGAVDGEDAAVGVAEGGERPDLDRGAQGDGDVLDALLGHGAEVVLRHGRGRGGRAERGTGGRLQLQHHAAAARGDVVVGDLDRDLARAVGELDGGRLIAAVVHGIGHGDGAVRAGGGELERHGRGAAVVAGLGHGRPRGDRDHRVGAGRAEARHLQILVGDVEARGPAASGRGVDDARAERAAREDGGDEPVARVGPAARLQRERRPLGLAADRGAGRVEEGVEQGRLRRGAGAAVGHRDLQPDGDLGRGRRGDGRPGRRGHDGGVAAHVVLGELERPGAAAVDGLDEIVLIEPDHHPAGLEVLGRLHPGGRGVVVGNGEARLDAEALGRRVGRDERVLLGVDVLEMVALRHRDGQRAGRDRGIAEVVVLAVAGRVERAGEAVLERGAGRVELEPHDLAGRERGARVRGIVGEGLGVVVDAVAVQVLVEGVGDPVVVEVLAGRGADLQVVLPDRHDARGALPRDAQRRGREGVDHDGERLVAVHLLVGQERDRHGRNGLTRGDVHRRPLDGHVVCARRRGAVGGGVGDGDRLGRVALAEEGDDGHRLGLRHHNVGDADPGLARGGHGLEQRDAVDLGVVHGGVERDLEDAVQAHRHGQVDVVGRERPRDGVEVEPHDRGRLVVHLHGEDALGRAAVRQEALGELERQDVVARREPIALEDEIRCCVLPAVVFGLVDRVVLVVVAVAGEVHFRVAGEAGLARPFHRVGRGEEEAVGRRDRAAACVDAEHEGALGKNIGVDHVVLRHRAGRLRRQGADGHCQGIGARTGRGRQGHRHRVVAVVDVVVRHGDRQDPRAVREGHVLLARLRAHRVGDGERALEAAGGREREGQRRVLPLRHGGGVADGEHRALRRGRHERQRRRRERVALVEPERVAARGQGGVEGPAVEQNALLLSVAEARQEVSVPAPVGRVGGPVDHAAHERASQLAVHDLAARGRIDQDLPARLDAQEAARGAGALRRVGLVGVEPDPRQDLALGDGEGDVVALPTPGGSIALLACREDGLALRERAEIRGLRAVVGEVAPVRGDPAHVVHRPVVRRDRGGHGARARQGRDPAQAHLEPLAELGQRVVEGRDGDLLGERAVRREGQHDLRPARQGGVARQVGRVLARACERHRYLRLLRGRLVERQGVGGVLPLRDGGGAGDGGRHRVGIHLRRGQGEEVPARLEARGVAEVVGGDAHDAGAVRDGRGHGGGQGHRRERQEPVLRLGPCAAERASEGVEEGGVLRDRARGLVDVEPQLHPGDVRQAKGLQGGRRDGPRRAARLLGGGGQGHEALLLQPGGLGPHLHREPAIAAEDELHELAFILVGVRVARGDDDALLRVVRDDRPLEARLGRERVLEGGVEQDVVEVRRTQVHGRHEVVLRGGRGGLREIPVGGLHDELAALDHRAGGDGPRSAEDGVEAALADGGAVGLEVELQDRAARGQAHRHVGGRDGQRGLTVLDDGATGDPGDLDRGRLRPLGLGVVGDGHAHRDRGLARGEDDLCRDRAPEVGRVVGRDGEVDRHVVRERARAGEDDLRRAALGARGVGHGDGGGHLVVHRVVDDDGGVARLALGGVHRDLDGAVGHGDGLAHDDGHVGAPGLVEGVVVHGDRGPVHGERADALAGLVVEDLGEVELHDVGAVLEAAVGRDPAVRRAVAVGVVGRPVEVDAAGVGPRGPARAIHVVVERGVALGAGVVAALVGLEGHRSAEGVHDEAVGGDGAAVAVVVLRAAVERIGVERARALVRRAEVDRAHHGAARELVEERLDDEARAGRVARVAGGVLIGALGDRDLPHRARPRVAGPGELVHQGGGHAVGRDRRHRIGHRLGRDAREGEVVARQALEVGRVEACVVRQHDGQGALAVLDVLRVRHRDRGDLRTHQVGGRGAAELGDLDGVQLGVLTDPQQLHAQEPVLGHDLDLGLARDAEIRIPPAGRGGAADERLRLGERVQVVERLRDRALDGDVEDPIDGIEDAGPVLGVEDLDPVGLPGLDGEVVGERRVARVVVAALVDEELPGRHAGVDVVVVDVVLLARRGAAEDVRGRAGDRDRARGADQVPVVEPVRPAVDRADGPRAGRPRERPARVDPVEHRLVGHERDRQPLVGVLEGEELRAVGGDEPVEGRAVEGDRRAVDRHHRRARGELDAQGAVVGRVGEGQPLHEQRVVLVEIRHGIAVEGGQGAAHHVLALAGDDRVGAGAHRDDVGLGVARHGVGGRGPRAVEVLHRRVEGGEVGVGPRVDHRVLARAALGADARGVRGDDLVAHRRDPQVREVDRREARGASLLRDDADGRARGQRRIAVRDLMRAVEHLAQDAHRQDGPVEGDLGEARIPRHLVARPDRVGAADVGHLELERHERRPALEGRREARVVHRGEHLGLVVRLQQDLEAHRARAHVAEHEPDEVGLRAVAEAHAGDAAVGLEALRHPVGDLQLRGQALHVVGELDAGVHPLAQRVGLAHGGALLDLLELQDRGVGSGDEVAAVVVEAGALLLGGEAVAEVVLADHGRAGPGVAVGRLAVELGAEQARVADGAGEVVVQRAEVEDQRLARRQVVAVLGAELERVVEVVDPVEVGVGWVERRLARIDPRAQHRVGVGVARLEDLDVDRALVERRGPERAAERLVAPEGREVVADGGEPQRPARGREERPVGRDGAPARDGRGLHDPGLVAPDDVVLPLVEARRDQRAAELHARGRIVEDGGGVLREPVDRALAGIDRPIGVARLEVVALDRVGLGHDLLDVRRKAHGAVRVGHEREHARGRGHRVARNEGVGVAHARLHRDDRVGDELGRVADLDQPGGDLEEVARSRPVVDIRHHQLGARHAALGRVEEPRPRALGAAGVRVAAVDQRQLAVVGMGEGVELRSTAAGREGAAIKVVRARRLVKRVPVLRVEVAGLARDRLLAVLHEEVGGHVARGRARLRVRAGEVGVLARRAPPPAVVGAVVVGEDAAVLRHLDVEGVAVAGRVDLHGPRRVELAAVDPVGAAERVVATVVRARPRRIVQRGHVVDVGPPAVRLGAVRGLDLTDLVEVHLEERRAVGGLLLSREVVGGGAGVGVAARGDDHPLRDEPAVGVHLLDHLEAVRRVVLLGPRQAAHDVGGLPAGGGLHEAGDHARVRVEPRIVAVVARADAAVGGGHVHDDGRRPIDQDRVAVRVELRDHVDAAADLPEPAAGGGAVVVEVRDRLDPVERLRGGDVEAQRIGRVGGVLVAEGHREDLHVPVHLADVEPPVRAPGDRRGGADAHDAVEVELARVEIVRDGHIVSPTPLRDAQAVGPPPDRSWDRRDACGKSPQGGGRRTKGRSKPEGRRTRTGSREANQIPRPLSR